MHHPDLFLWLHRNSHHFFQKGIPSLLHLLGLFTDEEACIAFLVEKGVLIYPACPTCNSVLVRMGSSFNLRCPTNKCCRVTVSLFSGTLFENAHLPKNTILLLAYLWLCEATHTQIKIMTGVSSQTVTNWTKYFRQLVTQMIKDSSAVYIGGVGKTVQIDESKFGKTKLSANGQGRKVEGSWVFGGVEKTNTGEPNGIFAVVVENRSADTLLPLIKRCVSQNKQIGAR